MMSLFSLHAAAAPASTGEDKPADSTGDRPTDGATDRQLLLQAGINDLYQTNLVQAEEKFDKLITDEPNEPQAYFFKAVVCFWRYNFGSKSAEQAARFFEATDKAIDLLEDQTSRFPAKTEAALYLGGLYGYRGLVLVSEKNYVGAFGDINKSNRITKRLAKESAKFPDAYFGLGMSHYLAGDIPKEGKWMAGLMGFSGSKEDGIEELEVAYQKGKFIKNEAGYVLASCYEKEQRYADAKRILDALTQAFPSNVVFLESLFRIEQKLGNAAAAEKICSDILALKNTDLAQSYTNAALTRAVLSYDAKRYDEALKDFYTFLAKANTKLCSQELIYDARFKAGVCCDETGDRETATKFYASVGKESQFYRDARARLKN